MSDPYFPLGLPSRSDVEAAARLLVQYWKSDLTGPEFGQMFTRMVSDPEAVVRRAIQLEAEAAQSQ